jgi:hypothetical protein
MSDVEEIKVKTNAGPAILKLERVRSNMFRVSLNLPHRDNEQFFYDPRGVGIENLDQDSDVAQVVGLSNRIRVDGVTLGTGTILASDVESIRLALKKVRIAVYNTEEI